VKKLFFILLFAGVSLWSLPLNAQTSDRTQVPGKTEDAVLVVYPNPARDQIMVKARDPQLQVRMVTFYSILGMQVAEYQINKNTAEIRLDRLRPGKYLMRYVLSDNTQKVTQIVKQ